MSKFIITVTLGFILAVSAAAEDTASLNLGQTDLIHPSILERADLNPGEQGRLYYNTWGNVQSFPVRVVEGDSERYSEVQDEIRGHSMTLREGFAKALASTASPLGGGRSNPDRDTFYDVGVNDVVMNALGGDRFDAIAALTAIDHLILEIRRMAYDGTLDPKHVTFEGELPVSILSGYTDRYLIPRLPQRESALEAASVSADLQKLTEDSKEALERTLRIIETAQNAGVDWTVIGDITLEEVVERIEAHVPEYKPQTEAAH